MKLVVVLAVIAAALGLAHGQPTAAQLYNPVSITVNSAPFDVIATPITPAVPYSQAAYQCNVTGDRRFPAYATGTYPLTVRVPAGQRVRVIFANGNLNGGTVTQNGEPGIIVQQGGSPIVQQLGGASPIVQRTSSPVVQSNAPPAVIVQQTAPTVVQQQPSYPTPAPVNPPPVTPVTPVTPTTPAPTPRPVTPSSPPPPPAPTTPAATTTTPAPTTTTPTPAPTTTTPTPTPTTTSTPAPTTTTPAPTTTSTPTTTPPTPTTPAPTPTDKPATPSPTPTDKPTDKPGRHLLQADSGLVPGGPNNGLVEYVALVKANTVPGFVVPNTQFGVPYVEFTASSAAAGQTATFNGVLVVAVVKNGVPQYPFTPNNSLSPYCQVNVNFVVA